MGKKIICFSLIGSLLLIALAVYFIDPVSRKIKSGLQVITNDLSASVFLNDQYLDKTPYINNQIQPGQYTLRIEPDDPTLIAYETPITLNKGLLTVITWQPGNSPDNSGGVIYELEELSNHQDSEVSFVTIPDNAIIAFDNQDKQFSPLLLKNVAVGHHEFKISLPSYEPQQHTINVTAGYKLKIMVKLIRQGSRLATATASATISPAPTSPAASTSATASNSAQLTGQRVLIKTTNFFQEEIEVLRVRQEPTVSSIAAGFVKVGDQAQLLATNEQLGWFQIQFTDALTGKIGTGWVSQQYSQLAN